MSFPAGGVLLVTIGSTFGSKNIGCSRASSWSSVSPSFEREVRRRAVAAACAAAASAPGVHFSTNFRAVRLLYGPVLIQNSFVYRWISLSVAGSTPSGCDDDGFEHVAHLEVVRVPLVVEDVAAGERRLIQMPDERLLFERQLAEAVRVQLHDGRIVDALEQVLAVDPPWRSCGASAGAAGRGRPDCATPHAGRLVVVVPT